MSNENNKCNPNCVCAPEKSEYVNSRPEFSIWLDMVAIQDYMENYSPYQRAIFSKAKLIVEKMVSENNGGRYGELNWMYDRDELFQYNFGKETLYDKLFRTLSDPSFFSAPEDVWDDVMIKNLIEVREAWQNYWMLFMTCPFGSGDMIKNCTGWRCMAWDTEHECCYRLEELLRDRASEIKYPEECKWSYPLIEELLIYDADKIEELRYELKNKTRVIELLCSTGDSFYGEECSLCKNKGWKCDDCTFYSNFVEKL